MKTVKENLIAVKELLATPATWTREVLARDAKGNEVRPSDDKAVCFCILGACERVVPPYLDGYQYITGALYDQMSVDDYISTLNDDKGFDAVHELLDAAIAAQP